MQEYISSNLLVGLTEADTIISLIIHYIDLNLDTVCGTSFIPVTLCQHDICSDVFDVTSSPCSPYMDINVTVVAITSSGYSVQSKSTLIS